MKSAKMKKLTIALLATCALSCVTLGSSLISANALTISGTYIVVEDGASLCLYNGDETDKDYNAMRFTFEMSTEAYATYSNATGTDYADGVEVTAMLVPTYLLNTTEVTTEAIVNSADTYKETIPFGKWQKRTGKTDAKNTDANGEVYYACAYLYNMPFYTYDVEYSACLSLTSGSSTIYTNPTTRSMSAVASEALVSDEYASADATTLDTLNEYCVATNEINNFDFSDSTTLAGQDLWKATRDGYGSTTWAEEWNDERTGVTKTGVVRLSEYKSSASSAVTTPMNFVPRQLASAYEGYDYVVFSMYVDDPSYYIERFNFTGDGLAVDSILTAGIERDGWKYYAFPISHFIDNYDNFLVGSSSSYLLMRRKAGILTNMPLDIYLDSIFVATTDEVALLPTATFATKLAEQETSVAFTVPGATVTNADTETYVLVKPDGTTETVTAGQSYTATTAGTYRLCVTVTSSAGLQASASYSFTVVDRSNMHEINNYSTATKVTSTVSNYSNNLSYLENYEGKSGVLKFTSPTTTQWTNIEFNPQLAKEDYADDTHIAITLRIEGGGVNRIDFTQYWASDNTYAQSDYSFSSLATNTWLTLEIPINAFIDNFDALSNTTTATPRIVFKANGSAKPYTAFTLYIDGMYSYTKA